MCLFSHFLLAMFIYPILCQILLPFIHLHCYLGLVDVVSFPKKSIGLLLAVVQKKPYLPLVAEAVPYRTELWYPVGGSHLDVWFCECGL
jgi:hypothetical protein